jgi:SRSO17 transposase
LTFCDRFSHHFVNRTRDVVAQSQQYLCGLMQAKRKNMERMAEVVPHSDDQSLQHFLSQSPWSDREVLDHVAQDASRQLGGFADSAVLIDESAFTKKGTHSVGVARQWNGRLGKVDNCQVGVFTALCHGDRAALVDARLYLPKEWTDDPERCRLAGVPRAERAARSKAELALQSVRHQRACAVQFNWVLVDGGYGKEPWLLRALDRDGEVFIADVHKDQRIYLEDPQPQIPASTSGRGRPRARRVAQTDPVRVDAWVGAQPDSAWHRVTLRDSTKGELRVETLHARVWVWDGEEPEAHPWHLIVRRECHARGEIKYALSNAPTETSPARLARLEAQRYWVERTFQDAKSYAGMGDYQARGWRAWHHHMALVAMALLFMLEERLALREHLPLLSCADIEGLLANFLPRRDRDRDELLRQLETRHQRRQASIDSAYAKQALAGNSS